MPIYTYARRKSLVLPRKRNSLSKPKETNLNRKLAEIKRPTDRHPMVIKALLLLFLVSAWPFANFMYANVSVYFQFWQLCNAENSEMKKYKENTIGFSTINLFIEESPWNFEQIL